MIAVVLSAVFDVCELVKMLGFPAICFWAFATDQIPGRPRKAAFWLLCIGGLSAILYFCGVRG